MTQDASWRSTDNAISLPRWTARLYLSSAWPKWPFLTRISPSCLIRLASASRGHHLSTRLCTSTFVSLTIAILAPHTRQFFDGSTQFLQYVWPQPAVTGWQRVPSHRGHAKDVSILRLQLVPTPTISSRSAVARCFSLSPGTDITAEHLE